MMTFHCVNSDVCFWRRMFSWMTSHPRRRPAALGSSPVGQVSLPCSTRRPPPSSV